MKLLTKEIKLVFNIISLVKSYIDDFDFTSVKIIEKNTNDYLTSLDEKIGEIIVTNIKKKFPNDGILCEDNLDNKSRISKNRVWIIDPIDGTGNLVDLIKGSKEEKHKNIGVHIALLIGEKIELGFVFLPFKNELFRSQRNHGAQKERNGKTIKMKINHKLNLPVELAGSIYQNPKTKYIVSENAKQQSKFGNVLGVCVIAVADNKISKYYSYPENPQRIGERDIAAPSVILEESGGKISDFDGNNFVFNKIEPYVSNGIIVSN